MADTEIIGVQNSGVLMRAELDQAVSTAKAYPRSVAKFKAEALTMATLDVDTAASCFYALKRGKGEDAKLIEGPSIRLAEIIGSAWGNLNYGARVVSIDDRFLTAQGVCRDLERNVSMTAEVTRSIWGKFGRYSQDMIAVTANAACAIALRNAIFKVVPMAYAKDILAQARKVAIGDAKTLTARRASMIEYFGKMGVDSKRVLWALEKNSLEDIGLDEIQILVGLATAIKDGDATIEESFPARDPKEAAPPAPATTGSKAEKAVAEARAKVKENPPAEPVTAPVEPKADARAKIEAPAERKPEPAPVVEGPIEPDVLTRDEKLFVRMLGKKRCTSKVGDMNDSDMQDARDAAEATLHDPEASRAEKAHAAGSIVLLEAEAVARAGKA